MPRRRSKLDAYEKIGYTVITCRPVSTAPAAAHLEKKLTTSSAERHGKSKTVNALGAERRGARGRAHDLEGFGSPPDDLLALLPPRQGHFHHRHARIPVFGLFI